MYRGELDRPSWNVKMGVFALVLQHWVKILLWRAHWGVQQDSPEPEWLFDSFSNDDSCHVSAGRALDVSDVTLINPDPVVSSVNSPSLLCVSSDWTVSGTGSLSLGHEHLDYKTHVLNAEPDRSYHSAAKVTWMSRNHTLGAFYCQLKNSNRSKVYTYKMLHEGNNTEKWAVLWLLWRERLVCLCIHCTSNQTGFDYFLFLQLLSSLNLWQSLLMKVKMLTSLTQERHIYQRMQSSIKMVGTQLYI